MKKALVIANMLFASSTVFGMYNLSPVDSGQSSSGVRQAAQNPDVEKFHKENRAGKTSLSSACKSGNLEIVKYLIEEQKVDVNKRRVSNLIDACESGNTDLVRYLIKHGANYEDISGSTLFFYTWKSINLDMVRYLVEEYGMNVHEEDNFKRTPLFYACAVRNLDMVKCFVELGANVNKKDKFGYTPSFMARAKGAWNVVEYLSEHGTRG